MFIKYHIKVRGKRVLTVDVNHYQSLFIDESKESLQLLNKNLLELEKNPEDQELITEIFSVAHTLKGMAGTMGYNSITNLTHWMENLLERMKNNRQSVNGKAVDTLFKCLDHLEKIVHEIVENTYNDETMRCEVKEIIITIETLLDAEAEKIHNVSAESEKGNFSEELTFDEAEKNIINAALNNHNNVFLLKIILSNDCMIPPARAYVVIKSLEHYGDVIKTVPLVEDLKAGKFDDHLLIVLMTKSPFEEVHRFVTNIIDVDEVILLKKNEDFVQGSIEKENAETDGFKGEKQPGGKVFQTVRVNANRLEQLMDSVGKLVITKAKISKLAHENGNMRLVEAVHQMDGITSEIQDMVLNLRMVAIEQVFNRFPRLVRDISKELGKEVDLRLSGQETEIDRLVIDEIGEPLVHLIRNALDHGIETKEERDQKGKPIKGTIELSAYNDGDNIYITVEDDGNGISPTYIRDKAYQKSLITAELARVMSDESLINLIFETGFSTMDTITDLSGRGIGMDVVKEKVVSLGGNVIVKSEFGKGTKISIILPSTLAVMQALLIEVGDETYAIPLKSICEITDIKKEDIKLIDNEEVIERGESIIPLVRLAKLLEIGNGKHPEEGSRQVIIIKSSDKYGALIISDLIGQQEVVIKPLRKGSCKEYYFSGAAVLGNGHGALIINVNTVLSR